MITAALVRWAPALAGALPGPRWLAAAISIPVVAQLTALPLVAWHFRSAVPGAVMANLAVPWILAPTLAGAAVATVLAPMWSGAAGAALVIVGMGEKALWLLGTPGRAAEMVPPRPCPRGWHSPLRRRAGWRCRGLVQLASASPSGSRCWGVVRFVVSAAARQTSRHSASGARRSRRRGDDGRGHDARRRRPAPSGSDRASGRYGCASARSGRRQPLRRGPHRRARCRARRGRSRWTGSCFPRTCSASPTPSPCLLRAAREHSMRVEPLARGLATRVGERNGRDMAPRAQSHGLRQRALPGRPPRARLVPCCSRRTSEERPASVAGLSPLRCGVLIVPHHGSRGSASPALLDATRPHAALIPAGPENLHHHPHPEVLTRLHDRHLPFRSPIHDGTCGAYLDDNGIWRPFP